MKKLIGLGMLILGLAWLVTTESGLRSAVYVSSLFISGELEISELQGNLIRHMQFKQLNFHNKHFSSFSFFSILSFYSL